jgi:hypothetical protein
MEGIEGGCLTVERDIGVVMNMKIDKDSVGLDMDWDTLMECNSILEQGQLRMNMCLEDIDDCILVGQVQQDAVGGVEEGKCMFDTVVVQVVEEVLQLVAVIVEAAVAAVEVLEVGVVDTDNVAEKGTSSKPKSNPNHRPC